MKSIVLWYMILSWEATILKEKVSLLGLWHSKMDWWRWGLNKLIRYRTEIKKFRYVCMRDDKLRKRRIWFRDSGGGISKEEPKVHLVANGLSNIDSYIYDEYSLNFYNIVKSIITYYLIWGIHQKYECFIVFKTNNKHNNLDLCVILFR